MESKKTEKPIYLENRNDSFRGGTVVEKRDSDDSAPKDEAAAQNRRLANPLFDRSNAELMEDGVSRILCTTSDGVVNLGPITD